MAIDNETLQLELKKSPWRRWLYGRPISKDAIRSDEGDAAYGFIETGSESIDQIIDYLFDRRNVMLVGPRGTGKSYMARKAVEAIDDDPRLGNVAVITLQGDPNKPPSDYFDDGILFTLEVVGKRARVSPSTVKAPFFSRAADRPAGEVRFDTDADGRLKLFKNDRLVDRVVIFWDEGNRSSPAMQNAMLSLLADGVIRRDGYDYQFPPVSCVMTRNPDGYDAQSAKLPSPLVDRFGVQLYVYNPDLKTLFNKVMPVWHADYLRDLKIELYSALSRLPKSGGRRDIDGLLTEIEGQLEDERNWRKVRNNKEARPAAKRVVPEKLDRARTELRGLKGAAEDGLREHAIMALERLGLLPDVADETFKRATKRVALIVLATWGDSRTPGEKAGMQYLSADMRRKLSLLGKSDSKILHAQRTLGELTRYGTSIRAFVDLMDTLCGDAIRAIQNTDMTERNGAPHETEQSPASMRRSAKHELYPAKASLDTLSTGIGRLLNHRCEPAFNPDREADKAREKTKALVFLAKSILELADNKLDELWT